METDFLDAIRALNEAAYAAVRAANAAKRQDDAAYLIYFARETDRMVDDLATASAKRMAEK